MTRDLVIIGCGGFGREVADVVDAINQVEPTWNLLGFVDDGPSEANVDRVRRRGSKVLGRLSDIPQELRPSYVVGIGNGSARTRVASLADAQGWRATILMHPTAVVGASLMVAEGSIFSAQVVVGSDVTVGKHVHLDRAVQVGHDSIIEDFTTAHPAAVISGNCHIKSGVELGTNCTLLPGTYVGANAVVGAASCVLNDVAPATVVKGVPAR